MKEIKYRAWNPNTQKMTDDFLVIPNTGKALQWYDDGHTGSVLDHFKVMQYTGLKDKNGKEIYEGDIVRQIEAKERIAVVEWVDDDASFIAWSSDNWNLIAFGSKSNGEVIGNVYQNLELLK